MVSLARRGMILASAAPSSLETKMLKLPRTIRLDPSDTFVFERAADPGEWAVSGAFVFGDCNEPTAFSLRNQFKRVPQ
jgi:hypothetical protein